MTTPTTAAGRALAEALETAHEGGHIVPPNLRKTFGLPPLAETEAEVVLAALAAAGYRITNEPPLTPERLAAARMSDEMEEWGYPIDAMEYATAILAALTSEEPT